MRPVATAQSHLAKALNRILGTEVNVRILRVLALASTPLSIGEVASRAQITARGARSAAAALEELGVVVMVGTGRGRPVELSARHPLVPALIALFHAEEARYETLLKDLRKAVESSGTTPMAAWVEGPVAQGVDRPGDSAVVGLLAEATQVDEIRRHIEDQFAGIESGQDVMLEARAMTRADLISLDPQGRHLLETVIPLAGPPPLTFLRKSGSGSGPGSRPVEKTGRTRSHGDLDERSRRLGQAIASAIKQDPSLVERARRYITHRLEAASAGEARELREWERILRSTSNANLRHLLTGKGPRATRLRQTLPFLDVLTAAQREAIFVATDSSPPKQPESES